MSLFSATVRRSQAISIAAAEEQQRLGHPEIDAEHLLFALLSLGGSSQHLLAKSEVTLHAAREASVRMHRARIALLGVAPGSTAPGVDRKMRIPTRFQWSERALKMMREADLRHDDTDLLVALLNQPSGQVRDLLQYLHVDAEALQAAVRVKEAERPESQPVRAGEAYVDFSGFIPASPTRVWELISTPQRRLEWDGEIFGSWRQGVDGVQIVTMRNALRRKKPQTGSRDTKTAELRVSRSEPERAIEWVISRPGDTPGTQGSLSITLEPAPFGTEILLSQQITRPSGLARYVLPLIKYSARQGLRARAQAISRCLR